MRWRFLMFQGKSKARSKNKATTTTIVALLFITVAILCGFILLRRAPQGTRLENIQYDEFSNYSFTEPGIRIIATMVDPTTTETPGTSDYWVMLKQSVTTEASSENFISILISFGGQSSGSNEFKIEEAKIFGNEIDVHASFTRSGMLTVITNPTALILVGKLPIEDYNVTAHVDWYAYNWQDQKKTYDRTDRWVASFRIM